MQITFLGTGTSQGVPLIACDCEVCQSQDPRDKRLRSSVLIESEGVQFVIDSGPDFRYQMLRQKVKHLDAVVFTHGHKDHIAGLDDIRAFNYFQNKAMDIYADEATQTALKREFHYIFENADYPGVPKINLHHLKNECFSIGHLKIEPILVKHYYLPVFGFRIGDFTYITDANYIAEEEKEKIKGSKYLVLNALRHEKHISHFTLSEALQLAATLDCEHTYFTHISHQLGLHQAVEAMLPTNVSLAYDGLRLQL